MGINCAVLTYNGTAHFGFTGDAQAAPNPRRLETFLIASFAELRKAARIDPPRRRKAPARTEATPRPEPKAATEPPAIAVIRIPAESVRATRTFTRMENELPSKVAV
jgi:hypothetical protein